MAKRTYPDTAQLRASIVSLLEERYGAECERFVRLGLPDDEMVERKLRELMDFYKKPYPDAEGRSPVMNFWYVLAPSGYAKDSLELDKLLHKDIASAKRPATKIARENRALQLISEIFDQGWKRDPFTKQIVWEKPREIKKETPKEKQERMEKSRQMANAMWRRGSRDK
jgi:hypothetical protein